MISIRFLSWAEKVSYVRYMNLDMKWIPGSANDFADLLSRMAERIGEAVKQREGIPMMYSFVIGSLFIDCYTLLKCFHDLY